MDARIEQLIADLARNAISQEQFISRYPETFDYFYTPHKLLVDGFKAKNADQVEWAMVLAHIFGLDGRYRDVFTKLAFEDWHKCHEDIAFELGKKVKDPANAEALYHMALKNYSYLEFDSAKALAVKCIWSLGNLNDPKALNMLKCLSLNDNKIIQKNALEQIKRCEGL